MAVVDIVRVDTAQYLLDTNRPVVVDTGLLGTFQIGVATLLHPAYQNGWHGWHVQDHLSYKPSYRVHPDRAGSDLLLRRYSTFP